ncbi:MAG: dihydrodipicolinate synthase family protein [Haemophilus parainfluenzae]
MRNLKGIFSALLVSFNEDGSINEKGLREIIRYNIDKMKIDGLYVGGSTGENFMLSTEEKNKFSVSRKMKQRPSSVNRTSG